MSIPAKNNMQVCKATVRLGIKKISTLVFFLRSSHEPIFDVIRKKVNTEKTVIVIDELPYWAEKDEALLSILQKYIDTEYIRAMEFGMPPISGWGLGIDRFLQFLTNSENIRDVVLYPLMRPRTSEEEE